MVMPAWEFEDWLARAIKPAIAAQFREIESLLEEFGQRAIEAGADADKINALLENARFNKDGWWD